MYLALVDGGRCGVKRMEWVDELTISLSAGTFGVAHSFLTSLGLACMTRFLEVTNNDGVLMLQSDNEETACQSFSWTLSFASLMVMY